MRFSSCCRVRLLFELEVTIRCEGAGRRWTFTPPLPRIPASRTAVLYEEGTSKKNRRDGMPMVFPNSIELQNGAISTSTKGKLYCGSLGSSTQNLLNNK